MSQPTPPIAITGMHRSGTSLTAAFVRSLGVYLGDRFYPTDAFNARGYFENLDFLDFQRSLVCQACVADDPGWPDWGWTESERFDRGFLPEYRDRARALIDGASAAAGARPWGWKDPRTSLLLDFWHELLPDAKFLFPYRFPWDAADSILRLNAPVFLERPDYPLRIWSYYNRQILDFYRRHRDRCLLFAIDTFLQNPDALVALLATKLGLSVGAGLGGRPSGSATFDATFDGKLFHQLPLSHPVVNLLRSTAPEVFELLAELDAAADLPSSFALQANARSAPTLPIAGQAIALYREGAIAPPTVALQQRVQQLEADLNRIHRSHLWRLGTKWYGFKDRLFKTFAKVPLARAIVRSNDKEQLP